MLVTLSVVLGQGQGWAAMLHIRLLGHYFVQADEQWLELPSRPVRLLFAYLVLHAGQPQPREHLAALFWPDSSTENARGNLRHALWQLRRSLGEAACHLTADDFSILFKPCARCRIDVVELARDPAELPSEEALMAAAAVYDGDLLPGFYEPWVVLERQRLEAVFEHKMELLLERLIAAQRWTATIGAAERWIALGAAPEPAFRALMTAHAHLGHTSHVQAAYDRCRDSLSEALDLEPSPETDALYRRLVAATHGKPDSAPPLRQPAPEYAHSAVGEAAELRRQLDAARRYAEHERQVAEAHHRAAVRSWRLAAGLALGLAAAVGAWARGHRRR